MLEFEDELRDSSVKVCSILRGPTQKDDSELLVKKAPINFSPCQTNQSLPVKSSEALYFKLLKTPSCGFNKLDEKFKETVSIISTGKYPVII